MESKCPLPCSQEPSQPVELILIQMNRSYFLDDISLPSYLRLGTRSVNFPLSFSKKNCVYIRLFHLAGDRNIWRRTAGEARADAGCLATEEDRRRFVCPMHLHLSLDWFLRG